MGLRQVVAAPFKRAGASTVSESEFVVAISLHRDWFTPAQAKRVLELAEKQGLIERSEEEVTATFEPASVEVPAGFVPAEDVLSQPSVFEGILNALLAAGHDKRSTVAAINRRQQELGITLEAAAALHASENDVEVDNEIQEAARALRKAGTGD